MNKAKQTDGLKGHQRALMVINYGYGNVLMLLPIFAAVENRYPSLTYFCTDHDLLHYQDLLTKAGVSHIEGFVEPTWRRFLPEDASAILEFACAQGITLIINMRLEAPDFDQNYFLFKSKANRQGITCWDLHDFGLSAEIIPISTKIQRMFSLHGAALGQIRNTWLQDTFTAENDTNNGDITVAVHTGASQPCKRWPVENWSRLINQTLRNINTKMLLFSGIGDDEKQYAHQILGDIDQRIVKKGRFIIDQTIDTVFSHLSRSDLIITHDTFVSHFAAACGVPAVVLYTVTDARIWQPLTNTAFAYVQSQEALKCSEMKVDGTCKRYYSSCDIECSAGVKLDKVIEEVQEKLDMLAKRIHI